MFKIKVNSLPENGLKLEQSISSEGVNLRLAESPNAKQTPIAFTSDLKLVLLCERAPHGMTLTGTVNTKCKQQCGLCADELERELSVPVQHIFKFHSDLPLPEDDVGLSYYNAEQVDILACIEDLLILQLSPFWHPQLDSQGKCSFCFKNPRAGLKTIRVGTQSLGDALKKAGIE